MEAGEHFKREIYLNAFEARKTFHRKLRAMGKEGVPSGLMSVSKRPEDEKVQSIPRDCPSLSYAPTGEDIL